MPSIATDAGPAHPLSPLTGDEISIARQALTDAGLLRETSRVVYLGLEEPPKEVLYGPDPASAERVVRDAKAA